MTDTRGKVRGSWQRRRRILSLPHGATIVIVGGGPAGAFFALRAARKARALRRSLNLIIVEKNVRASDPCPAHILEGCNYCAGGLSPNLLDILERNGILLPPDIIEGHARSLTIHGDWKSIELPVPEGRNMLSVFRGTRPQNRSSRYRNFDAFLLQRAVEEGARLVSGEVQEISYSPRGKPVVSYTPHPGESGGMETLESDFVVVSPGVNHTPGMDLTADRFFATLRRALPGFRPPQVRRALICEMQTEGESLRQMKDEVHFAQYGSKDIRVEMSSLMPKGRWMTVVLLGPTIDRLLPWQRLPTLERFLELPHIKRLLPPKTAFRPACVCSPNMTVGRSRDFCGDRIALVGDIVVSRLYKDGIFSAYATASALCDGIFDVGIDRASLEKAYGPTVRRLDRDNTFGNMVFKLNRLTFAHPFLSRIAYQAVLTELRTKPKEKRRLAAVLWNIVSGDDTYRRVLGSMGRPATVWMIFWGGVLVTFRNMLTERVFGLSWEGFGRYQTGVATEDLDRMRLAFVRRLGISAASDRPQFEKVYAIKIRASQTRILRELGRFGDSDRRYFRPRLVNVRRTAGAANEVGSTVRYEVTPRRLSFSVVLEKVVGTRSLLYRVQDGFARGGVLVFDIDDRGDGVCLLSIYVAFDFFRGGNVLQRFWWALFRFFFPAFLHDVVWNHSLCMLKQVVEFDED